MKQNFKQKLKKILRLLTRVVGNSASDNSGGSKLAELAYLGNQDAPTVLIFTEHINATYYISFDIPMKAMHAAGEVNFAVLSQTFVADHGLELLPRLYEDMRPSHVVMTRYALPLGREILDYFRAKGVPVIYHIDDDLLQIPESLGQEIQKRQGAVDVVESRKYLLMHCDLIYSSTEHLSSVLAGRFPNQKIFHGIYASYIEGLSKHRLPKQNNTTIIGYMGSKGHQRDLSLVEDALVQLMEEFPNLRFEVFGTIKMPEKLLRFGDRVASHRVNKNYYEFLEHLASLSWDIGLAPLEDEEFNHCKAPTKFIEYTAAGVAVAASNLSVYSGSAPEYTIELIGSMEWEEKLRLLLRDSDKVLSLNRHARIHCLSKFSLETLVAQLQRVLSRTTSSRVRSSLSK